MNFAAVSSGRSASGRLQIKTANFAPLWSRGDTLSQTRSANALMFDSHRRIGSPISTQRLSKISGRPTYRRLLQLLSSLRLSPLLWPPLLLRDLRQLLRPDPPSPQRLLHLVSKLLLSPDLWAVPPAIPFTRLSTLVATRRMWSLAWPNCKGRATPRLRGLRESRHRGWRKARLATTQTLKRITSRTTP